MSHFRRENNLLPQLKRSEVLIAVIGLVGVLATGVLSNWDKLFPKHDVVAATYSGYRPTGDFETEFRYYFDVSGSRLAIESMQRQFLQQMKTNLISQNPSDAEEIGKAFDIIASEGLTVDDVIKAILP